ncbi:MAG TPA: vitamin B12-dependent ribonucleotide reductase [Deltaproteobacteria bacterium]|nr:vitamin B12-dependent ribonucleotide reductase [Deltaproteobacteria bacterium]
MKLSENSLIVLSSRYLKRDEKGNTVEKPEELIERVAKNIAEADKIYKQDSALSEKQFYKVMSNLDFLPNSPTLMNAGRSLQQLSACFVLPIDDSMVSIFDAVKYTALIHQSGGGTGFSFSRLRPKGDIVRSTMGASSGPVSFMKVFNAATEAVKQGGTRRGANMGILRVDHPDIKEFIDCKVKEGEISNFNISVALTDLFMDKIGKQDDSYNLINPHTGKIAKQLSANKILENITRHAWANGEPGIVFIDRINAKHPISKEIEATNPCGEQPLLPYESCNLGSINLTNFVNEGQVDYDRLGEIVDIAVHFLDNVIDMNRYPLKQIDETTKKYRKIGLGVMGFADMLITMNIAYNSDEAITQAENIMKFVDERSKKASMALAEIRGTFPEWKNSKWKKAGVKLRNATTTTIAPTGTISMIADTSSGIEPNFSLAYAKNVLDGKRLYYVNKYLKKALGKLYSESLLDKIIIEGLQNIDIIPEKIKKVFVTSADCSVKNHIKIQAAFQKYVDNAVSKTINMPNKATIEDVKQAYLLAYNSGCKGLTVYRDGSRSIQVLSSRESDSAKTKPLERENILNGFTEKLKTGRGSLYVTVNVDKSGTPIEIFTNIGKSGGDTAALSEAIGRLISIALQNGVSLDKIVMTLMNITGAQSVWDNGRLIKSVPDAIAKVLKAHFLNGKILGDGKTLYEECPECGGTLEFLEGCAVCKSCGFSRCS